MGYWTAVLTQYWSQGRQTYLSEVEVPKRIMVLAMPPKIRRETRHSGTDQLNFCCLELAPASKGFPELSNEEAALRHRLELKVERTLYKVAVGLTQLDDCKSSSAHSWLVRIWHGKRWRKPRKTL